MDMNQNELMNHSWNVEMSMEDHHQHQNSHHHHHDPSLSFLNSSPSPSLWPSFSFPLHHSSNNNQIPPAPSSSQIITQPNSSSSTLFFGAGDHRKLEANNDNTDCNNILVDHEEQQEYEGPEEDLGAMKEMMYRIAAMQPLDIDPTTIRKPKRRNIRISDDPQSVAARQRRERISEKIRILQRLVPGGTKMNTASMLDEAIRYVKFLKRQIRLLQSNQWIGSDHHFNNSSGNKLFSLGTDTSTTITTTIASASGDPLTRF